jgi:hypothetical protein
MGEAFLLPTCLGDFRNIRTSLGDNKMSNKTEVAAPVEPSRVLVIPSTSAELAHVLKGVKMTPDMAALSIEWAMRGSNYLATGQQEMVVTAFASQLEDYKTTGSVDATGIHAAEGTRQKFSKLASKLATMTKLAAGAVEELNKAKAIETKAAKK